ncbi:MAG: acyl-ACP--UDP-N-acetylglucosamine O-acyltransferase [Salinisphaera sp.]|nr:acyl-ACP--UDP-N-acetylglucosamine O-acyltransferase [Salinisphaera sp.]
MAVIDPSARVDPAARLAADVQVGPYAVIGPHVEIGAATTVGAHAVITGHTRIGAGNRIFQFVSLGEEPQHRAYHGEPTRLEIGDGNTIREFCSIHRATTLEDGVTRVGNDNLLMAYVHIAHDCKIGNGITMANGASLAGHVRVGDYCVFGGFALVHQFVHIGTLAFIAYACGVRRDVPAFVKCSDYAAKPHGINSVGMRRHGYGDDDIRIIKAAYRKLYRAKLSFDDARSAIQQLAAGYPAVTAMLESLDASTRGIVR